MVNKPISQYITLSDESGAYRAGVTSDNRLMVDSNGGGGGGDVNLTEVGGVAVSLGQKVMASSLPVVIASNQSNLPANVAAWGGTNTSLGQKAASASVPVVLASDLGQIGVAYSNALTITRPADTTAYTAGSVIFGALTFPNMGPSGGRIMLTSAQLQLNISTIPTGMTSFFLALYSVTPPSALANAATWDLPSGDRASFLGIVQLGAPVDLGSTLYVEQNIINKQIKLAGTSLFGYLVTVGAYTPAANSEVYVNTLHSIGLGL